jgi:hypothetical protein
VCVYLALHHGPSAGRRFQIYKRKRDIIREAAAAIEGGIYICAGPSVRPVILLYIYKKLSCFSFRLENISRHNNTNNATDGIVCLSVQQAPHPPAFGNTNRIA